MTPADQPAATAGPVRIGVLGAARIVGGALIAPAAELDDVIVASLTAREPARAQAAAARHRIPRIHPNYAALLADPDIDAVYLPLPAALHTCWALASIEAGKHVLVEKPFTANAAAAEQLATLAGASPVVVMEAYHTGHHPMIGRLRDIIASGELGEVRSAKATFCVPIPPGRDIRWNLALGGGGLLDVGYYPVRMLRELFGDGTVTRARALQRGGIDRYLEANFALPEGVTGTVISSIWSRRLFASSLEVAGGAGHMRVTWPYHPQRGAVITVHTAAGRRRERADRTSSYLLQLQAFAAAVRTGTPVITDAEAALRQMQALDDVYRAAGMAPRP